MEGQCAETGSRGLVGIVVCEEVGRAGGAKKLEGVVSAGDDMVGMGAAEETGHGKVSRTWVAEVMDSEL